MKILRVMLILSGLVMGGISGYAEEVRLSTGETLSGKVLSEGADYIEFRHPVLGVMRLDKKNAETVSGSQTKSVAASDNTGVEWSRTIEAGFDRRRGNTAGSELNASVKLNRKTSDDEWTMEGSGHYAEDHRRMSTQKYYGLIRYAFSFGPEKKWYQFNKAEFDHDRFSDVDWRITPVFGVGYWFKDDKKLRWMSEIGTGFQHTAFRGSAEDKANPILAPRNYIKIKISEGFYAEHDFKIFPYLDEWGEYRFVSDGALMHVLRENLSVKFSIINEYNSSPENSGVKKHDMRILTGLSYQF
ncbi:MAG: DUF481 domain-containing protein [Candidatus Omnitrophica bacterium]|nr:DUF481 domain-containing protein [Candidatus Omnitrophota bacterium]